MPRKIHLVAGARPNFMKIAPLFHGLSRTDWAEPIIVHTGQHHDRLMSEVFLADFGLPVPHVNLGAGGGTHAETTAAVMVKYESYFLETRPDCVVVVGDVNSTVAVALAAKKLHGMVAHLEAGLRSFDRSMPEEINRVVTDAVSDLLWTPSPDADTNLQAEGAAPAKIARVGNIMIDAYEMLAEKIKAARSFEKAKLNPFTYGVVTLHRPSNVDSAADLDDVIQELAAVSLDIPLIFPVHPRTARLLNEKQVHRGIKLIDPMSYIDFMSLVANSRLVITDSGGIQEETTYLGIPCLTLRTTTERPITITEGTNRLVNRGNLLNAVREILAEATPARPAIDLWDGEATGRVIASLGKAL